MTPEKVANVTSLLDAVRVLRVATVGIVALLVGCAPAPRPPARVITVGHLPPGAAFRADAGALTLKLSYDASGTPTGFAAGTADDADIVMGFINTMTVKIENHLKQTLKVDLWLSRDGQRFGYTSSCPIAAGGSSHEMWPGAVNWVYVSNPRFLPPDAAVVCKWRRPYLGVAKDGSPSIPKIRRSQ